MRLAHTALYRRGVLLISHAAAAQGHYNRCGHGRLHPHQILPALSAPIGAVTGLAFDATGNLFITDPSNSVVLKMDTAGMMMLPLVGNGTMGFSGEVDQRPTQP